NGAGDLTVSGPFNWTGGTMSGTGKTVVPNTLNLSGSTHVLQRELDSQGTATWTAGDLQMANGAFVNTGTFTANSSGTLQSYGVTSGSTNTFTNSGSFIKQGTGTAQFIASTTGVTFTSTGPVDLQAGSLRLAAGGSSSGSSGTLSVASGTTLEFASNFSLDASASLTAPGSVNFTSGTTTIAGSYNVTGTTSVSGGTADVSGAVSSVGTTLTLTGGTANFHGASFSVAALNLSGSGTLTGSGTVTGTGAMNWSGGTLAGTGKTVVPNTLNLSGGTHVLQRELDSQGTATWTAGDLQMANGTFVNTGSFTANSSGTLQSYGVTSGSTNTFTNSGPFIQQGTGTAQFIASTTGVTFTNTGTVDVETGTLKLAGGFSSFSATTLTGGTYLVKGTFQFNNANIQTDAAAIVLDGSGAQIIDQLNNNALARLGEVKPTGSFTIQNGGTVT